MMKFESATIRWWKCGELNINLLSKAKELIVQSALHAAIRVIAQAENFRLLWLQIISLFFFIYLLLPSSPHAELALSADPLSWCRTLRSSQKGCANLSTSSLAIPNSPLWIPLTTRPIMAPVVDTSAIPGTVTLVDVQHVLHTRHLDQGAGDIVLIPTPSGDPDDPLNWSPSRKLMSTVSVSV